MVISVPLPSGTVQFSVNVREIEPNYESGIEWVQVGDRWKALDNGSELHKWTSDITIAKFGTVVAQAREAIKRIMRSGGRITLDCESYEQVFGPEIDYSDPIECVLIATDEPLTTGNLNENDMITWTFSVMPAYDLSEHYLKDTGSFPSGIRMLSCTRLDNDGAETFNAESRGETQGFGFYAPTAEIQYEGKLDDVAEAIAYLQKRRTLTMAYSASMVWPFTQGDVTETVQVISVDYDGAINKAGTMWQFTVLFAKVPS